MRRRLRTVLLVAVVLLGASSILVVGGSLVLLRTQWGNEWVRARIEEELQTVIGTRGRAMVGALVLRSPGAFTLDTLELRDADGTLLLSTGQVRARYDLWPLLDREARLRLITIAHPRAHFIADSSGRWSLPGLFASDSAIDGPPSRWRIRLDSLLITDGLVTVTRPDSLPELEPIRTSYAGIQLALGPSHLRLDTGAGEAALRRAAVDMSAPPLDLRHAEGTVVFFGDSLQLDLPLVRLPQTVGALSGSMGFGRAGGAPEGFPRLDLMLRADTVALADIAWITPLIPATGGGRAVVAITNGPGEGVIRYAIDSLDVTSTASAIRGRFIADVGGVFAIRDLDVTVAPLDFALIHEIFGDSMPPAPWDGAVRGRLRASGGPLDAWRIDPSALEFEDRRAGGATSRFTISGTLDLLGETAALRPLDVVIDSLDIHTLGAVTAVADSLSGYLGGRVQLRGPVDDLQFRDLRLVHTDGALPRSVVRGEGRLSTDTRNTWLDARLLLDTVSVAAFGKAFTPDSLKGILGGTLAVSARGDSVALDADLTGEGAHLTFVGATSLDTARLVLKGDASAERFDVRRFLRTTDLPDHLVTASATFGFDGTSAGLAGPVSITIDSTTDVAGITFTDGRARLELEPGGIRVDTLAVESPLGRLSARGRLSRDPTLRDSLRFDLTIDSVGLARGFLGDSLAEAWKDSLSGRIHARGIVHGSLDTLDIQADIEGVGLQAGSYAARHLTGFVGLEGAPSATRGLITFQADTVLVAGYELSTATMDALVRDARWADATVRVASGDTLEAEGRADVHWTPDSLRIRLDSLTARAPAARWALASPAEFYRDARSTHLDTLSLGSTDGASLDVAFDVDSAGPVSAFVRATRLPLRHARFTGAVPPGVDGLVSLEADMTGTRTAPLMQLTGRLDSARVDGVEAPSLTVRGDYADRNFDVDVRGNAEEREVFVLTGALPLDLSLRARTIDQRLIKEPLFVRIVADGSSLSGFEALLPGVSELSGGFDADMLVGGTWGDFEPRGVFLVRDGSFAVPALGTGFRDLLMDVSFSPDSVIIHRARLADGHSSNDTASVQGAFSRTDAGWRADFTSMARYLRVVDDPRVAEAEVSWQLQVRGPFDALAVSGEVFVPTANAYIGAQKRRVLDVSRRAPGPDTASVFVPRLEGLTVRLGNEVRLRSEEVNVQLTGQLQATGPLNDPSFAGEVVANRGTYRLDLGLLQRTFQVDSGVVRLAGPASAPHRLDIHASYIVRQAQQEDVLIGARLTGTTHEPRIVLSSTALGTAASETEIISYLLFGAPSFALDGNRTSALRQASAALVPSLGGAVERALGGKIPFISELRVSTVASDAPISVAPSSFESLLNSFALTAGSQLGTDTFLSVSTGVCRGQSAAAQALGVWFGIAAEYRPRERLSAQVSLDPGSSPCLRVGSFSQIYQFGLDLFRDWRW